MKRQQSATLRKLKKLWEDAIKAEMDRGFSRSEAASKVAREQPRLRSDYVKMYNAEHNTVGG